MDMQRLFNLMQLPSTKVLIVVTHTGQYSQPVRDEYSRQLLDVLNDAKKAGGETGVVEVEECNIVRPAPCAPLSRVPCTRACTVPPASCPSAASLPLAAQTAVARERGPLGPRGPPNSSCASVQVHCNFANWAELNDTHRGLYEATHADEFQKMVLKLLTFDTPTLPSKAAMDRARITDKAVHFIIDDMDKDKARRKEEKDKTLGWWFW